MLLAQIKGLGKLTPIIAGSREDFRAVKKTVNPFDKTKDSTHSTAQKGKAWIRIDPLNKTDLNEILEIFIIGDKPFKGKVIAQKKSFLRGQEIEVYFEDMFEEGFHTKMEKSIYPGGGLIGFTSLELKKLDDLEFQRKVSGILVDFMMSEHTEEIKSLAQPCFILSVKERSDAKSHFCGVPKYGFQKDPPTNAYGQSLFHLGTFKTNEVTTIYNQYSDFELLDRLSFYIDIQNTNEGWPVERERYKVLMYNSLEENIPQMKNYEDKKSIHFHASLDFPHFHHSVVERLNLSIEESRRYQALRNTINYIMEGGVYQNKLFGYPDLIDTCVSFEAERLKTKKSYKNIDWESSNKWMLLLQVSPYNNQFRFFDQFGNGIIYFMIKGNDLKRGYFEDVQVVVQPIEKVS